MAPGLRRVWPVLSGGHGGQLDKGIVAQRCHGFQGHVAGALDGPFIVLFQEDSPDEADDGLVVGEDADDRGAPLDLVVQALDRVGRVQLGPVRYGRPERVANPPFHDGDARSNPAATPGILVCWGVIGCGRVPPPRGRDTRQSVESNQLLRDASA